MRKLLLFFMFSLAGLAASAQSRLITGVVTSAGDGAPVPGANVIVKGTTSGTATDADGKFSLSISADAKTLIVSFIGYATKEVAIETSNVINVALVASTEELQEQG